jgi:hypothetical protein
LLSVFLFPTAEILSEIIYGAKMSLNLLFLGVACLGNLEVV